MLVVHCTNLPGFRMPRGSSACLTWWCSFLTAGDAASGHQGSLARPMPCSPVMTPFHASTCWNRSSSAACERLSAAVSLIHHDVHVDVAVARVAETRDGQAVSLLQAFREGEQILQPAAGNHDVLVQLRQPRVAQRGGKLPAQFPDRFALFWAEARFHERRPVPPHNLLQRPDFVAHGKFLPVQFHNQMGAATAQPPAFRPLSAPPPA